MQKKTAIDIYPNTHPYVCITRSGLAHHILESQYEQVAEAWAGRKMTTIEYRDPRTDKVRPLNIDGVNIEILDEAEYARKMNWESQGGYVCVDGRLVDEKGDCYAKPDYSMQKDFSAGTFADVGAEMAQENMDRFQLARDTKNKEIQKRYDEIEQAIKERGAEWCLTNRGQWEEKAKYSNTLISWYMLFQVNEHTRYQSAASSYVRAQQQQPEVQVITEPVKARELLPF